ncbi:MAG: hypothetical protein IKB16_09475 [Lentisphaeria bacterium]|nr:hypothetical protein [Lentisphaeria bacterium]
MKFMTALFVTAVVSAGVFAAESQNLLSGTWSGKHVWIHTSDKEAQPLRSKVPAFVKFETAVKDGKTVLSTDMSEEMVNVAGKYAASVSASWFQNVKLPDTKGGKYKFKFTYTCIPGKTVKNQAFFLAFPKAGNKTGKLFAKSFNPKAENAVCSYVITVPAGTDSMDLYLRLNAPGKLTLVDPVLVKIADSK